ncbi:hypothetical protein VPNG_04182 [Cytospora leucostoma]|uniref:Uncharacterized protein n=1 Tax=Cytospora leucostoma TaxID=1230097 RepID=A0A423XDB1_9PEZI|nr:hypothetical protein VPNG_04182 [Cytospora leucostoma]
MADLYFTNKLDEPNGRSGEPVKLGYPAPPGVSDRFWYRLANVANTKVYRVVKRGEHRGESDQKIRARKYRKALMRLAQCLGEAKSEAEIKAKKQAEEEAKKQAEEEAKKQAKKQTKKPTKTQTKKQAEEQAKKQAKKQAEQEAEQLALYQTRPNLGEDFYVWMLEHGFLIDTATWEFTCV